MKIDAQSNNGSNNETRSNNAEVTMEHEQVQTS